MVPVKGNQNFYTDILQYRGVGQDAVAAVVAIFLTTRESVASKNATVVSVYLITPGSLNA